MGIGGKRSYYMQNLKRLVGLTLCMVFLLYCGPAYGKVYIDIDSPSFQKFPIAIADFQPLRSSAEKGDLSLWFADTLSRDMLITGYFTVIDRKAFLEDTSRAGITGEGTRFADWTAIGAEYLIKGGFLVDGKQLTTEFRLFDVVKGELIVGKRYVGTPDDKNRMVVQFANEVLLALTGEAGLFDTGIAFIKKSGDTSDLFTINFDGSDLRRITNYGSLTVSPRWSPDGRRLAFTCFKDEIGRAHV
jgi:TolB protein